MIEISAEAAAVDFDPPGELQEIVQNIQTLLRTPLASVPLNRALGVAGTVVDRPIHLAAAFYEQSVIKAINDHEPRVEVVKVSFADSDPLDGVLKPSVIVKLRTANV